MENMIKTALEDFCSYNDDVVIDNIKDHGNNTISLTANGQFLVLSFDNAEDHAMALNAA